MILYNACYFAMVIVFVKALGGVMEVMKEEEEYFESYFHVYTPLRFNILYCLFCDFFFTIIILYQ